MINKEGNILTQSNCGKLTSFCAQMMSPLTVNHFILQSWFKFSVRTEQAAYGVSVVPSVPSRCPQVVEKLYFKYIWSKSHECPGIALLVCRVFCVF